MEEIKTNKIEAAKEQLITAIKLFFLNESPVAVHALTCAAYEVFENLCVHRGLPGGTVREGLKSIKPEYHKSIINKVDEAKNFFKHADRDPDSIILWKPGLTQYLLWDCSTLHRRLVTEMNTPEIYVYMLWFRINHNDLWSDAETQIDKLLPGVTNFLSSVSKSEFYATAIAAYESEGCPPLPSPN